LLPTARHASTTDGNDAGGGANDDDDDDDGDDAASKVALARKAHLISMSQGNGTSEKLM
jgi:hypothetical protein